MERNEEDWEIKSPYSQPPPVVPGIANFEGELDPLPASPPQVVHVKRDLHIIAPGREVAVFLGQSKAWCVTRMVLAWLAIVVLLGILVGGVVLVAAVGSVAHSPAVTQFNDPCLGELDC